MKNAMLLILSLVMYCISFAQVNFPAFDNASTNTTALMNGSLKIKTNSSLIIGHEYGTSLPNNGRFRIHNVTGFGHTYVDFKHNLYFRAEYLNGNGIDAVPLTLFHDGIVGIGVEQSYTPNTFHSLASEGHKLLVNGSILCEKVKVIGDVPNSDHVFEDDYNLRTLEEVEKFVTKNKHLPEIPSAKEFKENGYSIGEMDDVLLRKVEELTLYIIELKKEINELKESK